MAVISHLVVHIVSREKCYVLKLTPGKHPKQPDKDNKVSYNILSIQNWAIDSPWCTQSILKWAINPVVKVIEDWKEQ